MNNEKNGIIIAADVQFEKLPDLVKSTHDLKGILGYKLGFKIGLEVGLPKAVQTIRNITDKTIMYDHQKAATDIPDTGKLFAKVCKQSGVDSVILFPQAGPVTEAAWIKAMRDENLNVIVGGLMSHKGYTQSDGGFIADDSIIEMYLIAADHEVTDFVAPATNPKATTKIRMMLEHRGIKPIIYTPGIGTQGGLMEETSKAAGRSWCPIVGRSIYAQSDIRSASMNIISKWEEACKKTSAF